MFPAYIGPTFTQPTRRAEALANLRVGQRVRLAAPIVDRFPFDDRHQLRVPAGSLVEITALAGHSGQQARYRFETLDVAGRRSGLWNMALESQLEALPRSGWRQRVRGLMAVLLPIALGVVLAACAPATPSASPRPDDRPPSTPDAQASVLPRPDAPELAGPTGATERVTVIDVVDGDTIKVRRADGSSATVRYIGVDTPETVHPTKPVQPFGPEASAANHELVDGAEVVLETDVSDTDRYGRLLRYVWLERPGGWLLVNAELLRLGLATVSTYPPDVKWVDPIYRAAQAEAQGAGRGIWSGATPSPAASHSPEVPISGCHPDYGACLPIVEDVDCGEIVDRDFRSTGDDPYGLDRDGNGIACEAGS